VTRINSFVLGRRKALGRLRRRDGGNDDACELEMARRQLRRPPRCARRRFRVRRPAAASDRVETQAAASTMERPALAPFTCDDHFPCGDAPVLIWTWLFEVDAPGEASVTWISGQFSVWNTPSRKRLEWEKADKGRLHGGSSRTNLVLAYFLDQGSRRAGGFSEQPESHFGSRCHAG